MALFSYDIFYDESVHRIIGIPFFIVAKDQIDFVSIKNRLEGQSLEENVDIDDRYFELDQKIIPDVFLNENAIITSRSNIDSIRIAEDYLWGRVTVDYVFPIFYRGKNVIIVQTKSSMFQIIEDDISKNYFLIIYAPRSRYKEIMQILSELLYNMGIRIIPAQIRPKDLNAIYIELMGDLLDTTIEGIASETISKKRIFGRGFQDDEIFKKDMTEGTVYQHRFTFLRKSDGNPMTVSMSGDGLIRFYNNVSYKYFISFLGKYILYRLQKSEIKPLNIPITAFLTDEEDEE